MIGVTGHYKQIGMDFISGEVAREMEKPIDEESSNKMLENVLCRQNRGKPISREIDKEMDQFMTAETGKRIPENGHSRQDGVDPIITESGKDMDQRMSEDTSKQITENGDSRQDGVEISNKEAGEDRDPLMNEETEKTPDDDGDSNIAERSCLLSTPFCLLLVWQAFLQIDLIFTFGTLNSFLTRLADGDEDVGKSIVLSLTHASKKIE